MSVSLLRKPLGQWPVPVVLAGTVIVFFWPFLMVELFPAQLDTVMGKSAYVAFHNIAEFFSIMVSLSVFSVGWYTYNQSKDRQALFLGVAFLAVGLLDFMHTMSNAAMPGFITENSTNKSTQFWIAARLFNSSAFLMSAFVYPDSGSRWLSKPTLLTTALLATGLIFAGVTFFPSSLPATAVPGIGLTPLKRYLELLVILLLLSAGAAYWRRMRRTGDRLIIYYLAAFIICIYSEAVFASYKTGFDTYNVLGHIYKVIAFYLIYKGVFISSVNAPYERLAAVSVSRDELSREVQERKRVEETLRASEERYRLLTELSPDAVVVHRDGKFVYANAAALALYGANGPEDLIGTDIMDRVHPRYRDAVKERVRKIHDQRSSARLMEQKHLRLDGREIDVDAVGTLITFQDRPSVLTVIRDITERKKAEADVLQLSEDMAARNLELESTNKELEAFIYSVSHDLRAPLRSVSSFAKIVIEEYQGRLDAQADDYLARIYSGSEKMSERIEALMHLSRISRQELELSDVDLSRIASLLAYELGERNPGRQVEVVIVKDLIARADLNLIKAALSNLFENAWKFTSKTEGARVEFGRVDCGLRDTQASPPGGADGSDGGSQQDCESKTREQIAQGKTVYYLKDNGAGFDPAYAGKMFWPFQRLHSADEFEGTGIGLAITERVIRRHGGRIWAEGAVGKGATFYFTL